MRRFPNILQLVCNPKPNPAQSGPPISWVSPELLAFSPSSSGVEERRESRIYNKLYSTQLMADKINKAKPTKFSDLRERTDPFAAARRSASVSSIRSSRDSTPSRSQSVNKRNIDEVASPESEPHLHKPKMEEQMVSMQATLCALVAQMSRMEESIVEQSKESKKQTDVFLLTVNQYVDKKLNQRFDDHFADGSKGQGDIIAAARNAMQPAIDRVSTLEEQVNASADTQMNIEGVVD